ncbi:RNHCP domain-containing protein [Lysinibacillus xylanilyticus]|uniref:RNHCP domain-containing protein n=1 Tax=Lysinibacillus xylanilyticus TaxID=582475 RepID=UPI0037F798B4
MSRKNENIAFQCENCGTIVEPNGSFRNHCPNCLFSKHMDNVPGDRASTCKGLMRPIGVDYTGKKAFNLSINALNVKRLVEIKWLLIPFKRIKLSNICNQ